MIQLRPATGRGRMQLSWLNARHSFSFADYYDPAHMGFRDLRVLNEDQIAPGGGFPTHGHRDMEIITYILDGAIRHEDDTGGAGTLTPGWIQHMSAGSGIRHSEFNDSSAQGLHLFQVWITPNQRGVTPSYTDRELGRAGRRGTLRLLASPDGRDGSLAMYQDAFFYDAELAGGERVVHLIGPQRGVWIQLAAGEITVNGTPLKAGDGVAIEDESAIAVSGKGATPGHLILIDLP